MKYLVIIDGTPKEIFTRKEEAENYVEDIRNSEERGIALENNLDIDDDYERINSIHEYEGDSCLIVPVDVRQLPDDGEVLLETEDGEEVEVDVEDIRNLIDDKASKYRNKIVRRK